MSAALSLLAGLGTAAVTTRPQRSGATATTVKRAVSCSVPARAGRLVSGPRASSSSTRLGAVHASTATLADEVRADFPILEMVIPDTGKSLVYLDNAASSQTPTEVVDAHEDFHRNFCANVHRGVHYLSGKATDKYEAARQKVSEGKKTGKERGREGRQRQIARKTFHSESRDVYVIRHHPFSVFFSP